MKDLMEQCQKLDAPKLLHKKFISDVPRGRDADNRGLSSIFSGVFPGKVFFELPKIFALGWKG